jgi:uncharacterized RDD family membrane protein YckC
MSPAGSNRYLVRTEAGRRREVVTPEGVPLGLTLSDAGDRAAAFLLDLIFIAVALFCITLLASMAGAGGDLSADWTTPFVLLVSFFLRNFYFMFFELRWQGSTPGKRIIGIRVIDGQGGPLTADAVVARNLVRDIEVFLPLVVLLVPEQLVAEAPGWAQIVSTIWLLVFAFMPLFNKDRMRVGDLVGGTLVVLAPKALLLPDIGGEERERATHAAGTFRFTDEQLDVYGEYELQVLENVLRGSADDAHHAEAMAAVCESIKTKIQWDPLEWNVDPERFLREFYAAQRARLEKKLLFGKRQKDKFSRTQ